MQEDIENKSLTLIINTSKLTARTLATAFMKFLRYSRNKIHEHQNVKPQGKQSVKQLIAQNQGVENTELADRNEAKSFDRYARQYGVDYAIQKGFSQDGKPRYILYFKARDRSAINQAIPVISSVGKKNVKIRGVQSKYKLVNYTIPEQLLRADPDFLALMIEAEKYIGYPYVYGASNPDTGFDCSGYVCWVFNNSGVCDVGRMGANGLYSLCSDVSKEDARPGDLVFFEKTMGADVKGITHVGIYVGNDMMIHAGDPVGFADLKSEKWSKRLYGFGRLPLD